MNSPKIYCPTVGEVGCRCLPERKKVGPDQVPLQMALRKLFTDHAVYTKFYTESELDNIGDLKAITTRLLRNQKDIGDFLKPIIGDEKGNAVTALLTEHILRASAAIKAIKSGDEFAKQTAYDQLFANSAEVAKGLSSLNPIKLPYAVVKDLFDQHNLMVVNIAQLHFNRDYEREYQLYDAYLNHMMFFSDTLFMGLSK